MTTAAATPYSLSLTTPSQFTDWVGSQSDATARWLRAQGFSGAAGTLALLPGSDGLRGAVLGVGDPLDPFAYAHAPTALPAGDWQLTEAFGAATPSAEAAAALHLGWGLGSYRFSRYREAPRAPARLLGAAPHAEADAETAALIAACGQVRDLINTPTEHMGPAELEAAARALAARYGADIDVLTGEELLRHNFPAIHAVGRASHRAPRLIALRWGEADHPLLAVVGKGVCFDTGGLDIKAAAGMRNMKKDMGGAAHALGLAQLVMERRLPVRLLLLVPAVENALGPDAYRPGEVVATRKGISVEIDNTDAEGRVILCDALTYACEHNPHTLLDFATLTGAARIALGPDLPALFANDDALANAWLDAGARHYDPLWRMPLWKPYLRYLSSGIADIANGSSSSMAGCVTAALYLERFVPGQVPWAHLDVYSWNDSDRPGRPAGGEAQALRSCFAMLKARFGG